MDISSDSIFSFLQNLRQKLISVFIFVFLASFLCYFFRSYIWHLIEFPYLKVKPGSNLIFITPFEAFSTNLEISIFGGVFLALPFIFYQIISMIPDEERYVGKSIVLISIISFLLFISGVFFCYFIVIPQALKFFLQFENEFLSAQWTVDRYLSFLLWTLFSFGLMFEMPLLLCFLAKLNIIRTDTLKRNRSYAILSIFIAAGFLTPGPDVVSQILLAVPMVILFEISLWVSC